MSQRILTVSQREHTSYCLSIICHITIPNFKVGFHVIERYKKIIITDCATCYYE